MGAELKQLDGQVKVGSATTSRSESGACSIDQDLTDLVLRCSGKGSAQATYVFTLPTSAGSVTAQVNFVGRHPGSTLATKRLSSTQFRVTVTAKGRGSRADIASVMIEYYH